MLDIAPKLIIMHTFKIHDESMYHVLQDHSYCAINDSTSSDSITSIVEHSFDNLFSSTITSKLKTPPTKNSVSRY